MTASPLPAPPASAGGAVRPRGRARYSVLTTFDKLTLAAMVALPTFLVVALVILPAVASLVLSFFNWNGVSAPTFAGFKNYTDLVTVYKPFVPAVQHNVLWLVFFLVIATPIGILFAVLLDKEIKGTRFYQSALYLPVVLSLAIVGFIWTLQYAPDNGLINSVMKALGLPSNISWLGNPSLNLWAVLIAASWRHVGYVMILYLAGLKSVDPSLREAAAIDGANDRQTFFRVVLPIMRPINIVILVITVIESLRAFDLAFVINKGLNGLELLSTLVTNNIIGETSRIGFGSAIAVVLFLISVVPITIYLSRSLREDRS